MRDLNNASQYGSLIYVVPFVALIGFMFWTQRQDQRRRQKLRESLHKGDRVVTAGGIHGTITEVKEDVVRLRVADKVELTLEKSGVSRVLNGKKK